MPEPTLAPAAPATVVTNTPQQNEPVIAKGFDDPNFLQAAEKAFMDRAAQEKEKKAPTAKTEAPPEVTPAPAPAPAATPEPAPDRPPTPRKASEWAAFHDAKVKIEKERDELKSKLEQFKDFDPKEYESIKTERAKLSEKLEAIALEKSDRFQNYFNTEKDNIHSLIKSAVGDKADKVNKLLELPDSDWRTEQLEAIAEELTPLRKARLERAAADMDKLNLERTKALENSAQNWKKLQEVEKEERTKAEAKAIQVFEDEIRQMSDAKDGIATFQKKDGDTAWNKSVSERIELAKAIYRGEVPPQEKARHAAWAASVPDILNTLVAATKENAQLRSELEKLRTAEPGLGDDSTGEPSGDEYKDLSHGEALAKMVEKAGGFAGR